MVLLGVILLVLGLLFAVKLLFVLGIVLLIVGAVLFLGSSVGYQVGPRRHYW